MFLRTFLNVLKTLVKMHLFIIYLFILLHLTIHILENEQGVFLLLKNIFINSQSLFSFSFLVFTHFYGTFLTIKCHKITNMSELSLKIF